MIQPGHYFLNPRKLSWSEILRLSGWLLPFGILYKLAGQASDLTWLPELCRDNPVRPEELDPEVRAALVPHVDFLVAKGFTVAAWKTADPRNFSRSNETDGACCLLWKGQTGAFLGYAASRNRQQPAVKMKNTVFALITHRRDGSALATTDFAKGLDPHPDDEVMILRAPLARLLEEHQRRSQRLGERALSFGSADAFLDQVDSHNAKVFAWRISKGLYLPADSRAWPEIEDL
ncbi:MAG: hypothetical protein RL095_3449 [Verrucomicrobiota bacterium]|jgi:hypothetical protein